MKDVINIESPILTRLIGAFIKKKLKKSGIKVDNIDIHYLTLVRRLSDDGYVLNTKLAVSMSDKAIEQIKGELE